MSTTPLKRPMAPSAVRRVPIGVPLATISAACRLARQPASFVWPAAILVAGAACAAHAGGTTPGAAANHPAVVRDCTASGVAQAVAVRVEAVDESGAPVADVTLRISSAGDASGAAVLERTDARGVADLGVGDGLWRIEASRPGFSTNRCLLDLRGGQTCTVRFELRRAKGEFEF
jgi:hypothetical protein